MALLQLMLPSIELHSQLQPWVLLWEPRLQQHCAAQVGDGMIASDPMLL